jgi:hypothetical protein
MDQIQRPRAPTPPPPPRAAAAAVVGNTAVEVMAAQRWGRKLRERHNDELVAARTRAVEVQKAAAKQRAIEALTRRQAEPEPETIARGQSPVSCPCLGDFTFSRRLSPCHRAHEKRMRCDGSGGKLTPLQARWYADSRWRRLQEEYRRGTLTPVEDRPPTAEVRIRAILASHANEAPCNAVRAEVWDVATAGGHGRAAAMLAMDLDRDGGAKTADPAPAPPQPQEGADGPLALPQPRTLPSALSANESSLR